MNQLAVKQISEKEKQEHASVIANFKCAFLNRDLEDLESLMHDKGIFFSKMKKQAALAYLFSCLKRVRTIEKGFHMEVKEGYSIDFLPCEPVLEFRYPDFNPFEDDMDDFKSALGSPENKDRNEVVFCFAFDFKAGQIVSIRHPTLCDEFLDRYIKLN
jgi:hypothetical protein